jgi:hypothetical protein
MAGSAIDGAQGVRRGTYDMIRHLVRWFIRLGALMVLGAGVVFLWCYWELLTIRGRAGW